MADKTAKDLGEYIFTANPYAKKMEPMLDQTEIDTYNISWYFRNGSHTVAKALRIPYCYKDKDGLDVREYLLVGFEGGGQ